VQPRLKELCAKYGIPYIQESVFQRFRTMIAISLRDRTMKRVGAAPAVEPARAG
jgi:hypothetical protein